MTTLLQEAISPEEYRATLNQLLAEAGTLTGAAESGVVQLLDTARKEAQATLGALAIDSPSRALYERTLGGIDGTINRLRTDLGLKLSDWQSQGYLLGVDTALKPIAGTVAGLAIGSFAISTDQLTILGSYSADLVQGITLDLRKKINSEISSVMVGAKTPHDAAMAIGKNLTDPNHFSSTALRARAIVVTEVGRAQALGAQAGMDELRKAVEAVGGNPDSVRKRWINAHLPGARATHLEAEARYHPDGEIGPIPTNQVYQVGAFTALYPRDPSLPASESVFCHCVSVTIIDDGSMGALKEPEQLVQAQTSYTAAKNVAAAPAENLMSKLPPSAAQFKLDPYGAAGLKPVKALKNGQMGYGGEAMAKALGYADPKKSGFQWDGALGAFKHKMAPAGKQLPDFDKLDAPERAAVMKNAGLSASDKLKISTDLEQAAALKKALAPSVPKAPPVTISAPAAPAIPPVKPPPAPRVRKAKVLPSPTVPIGGARRSLEPAWDMDTSPEVGKKRVGIRGWTARAKRIAASQNRNDVDVALKIRIQRDIGAELGATFNEAKLINFIDDTGWSSWGADSASEKVAATITRLWAQTSGDAHYAALAAQRAVAELFDLPWPPVGYNLSPGYFTPPKQFPDLTFEQSIDWFYKKHGDVLRSYVETQYRLTQAELATLGSGDYVVLVRGMNPGSSVVNSGLAPVMLNPASSFSTTIGTAKKFGSRLFFVRVPKERILGSTLSGWGCYNEQEWIVLGAKLAEPMNVVPAHYA